MYPFSVGMYLGNKMEAGDLVDPCALGFRSDAFQRLRNTINDGFVVRPKLGPLPVDACRRLLREVGLDLACN